jgi:hypothetical protein
MLGTFTVCSDTTESDCTGAITGAIKAWRCAPENVQLIMGDGANPNLQTTETLYSTAMRLVPKGKAPTAGSAWSLAGSTGTLQVIICDIGGSAPGGPAPSRTAREASGGASSGYSAFAVVSRKPSAQAQGFTLHCSHATEAVDRGPHQNKRVVQSEAESAG